METSLTYFNLVKLNHIYGPCGHLSNTFPLSPRTIVTLKWKALQSRTWCNFSLSWVITSNETRTFVVVLFNRQHCTRVKVAEFLLLDCLCSVSLLYMTAMAEWPTHSTVPFATCNGWKRGLTGEEIFLQSSNNHYQHNLVHHYFFTCGWAAKMQDVRKCPILSPDSVMYSNSRVCVRDNPLREERSCLDKNQNTVCLSCPLLLIIKMEYKGHPIQVIHARGQAPAFKWLFACLGIKTQRCPTQWKFLSDVLCCQRKWKSTLFI